jgi:uncharacterized protein with PIN domain
MFWECGECGVVEGKDGVRIDAVCHHCGKPLCRKHQVRIVDDALSSDGAAAKQVTFHCDDCKKSYHPRAALVTQQETV